MDKNLGQGLRPLAVPGSSAIATQPFQGIRREQWGPQGRRDSVAPNPGLSDGIPSGLRRTTIARVDLHGPARASPNSGHIHGATVEFLRRLPAICARSTLPFL